MSKVICECEDLVAVADAIRNKTGNSTEMSLAQMPTNINSINGSGGGLPSGVTEWNMGTLTYASEMSGVIYIPHGLSRIPNFWAIYTSNGTSEVIGTKSLIATAGFNIKTDDLDSFYLVAYSNDDGTETYMSLNNNMFTDASDIGLLMSCKIPAGVTYHWIAAVVEGMS